MSDNPDSKVVLITGCSSGIGLATVLHLAKKGFRVVATMRDLNKRGKLDEALQKNNCVADLISLDVHDSESIRAAVKYLEEKYGRLDVLLNNAGITIDGFFEDLSEADVEKLFRTNVFGVFNMTREVLPLMRKQKSGLVVNVGSIAGQWALPQIGVYSSTKFAIEGFTEALRYEVEPFGIHVSVVEPCFVNTEMVHENRNVAAKSRDPKSPYFQFNERCEVFYDDYGKKYSIQAEDVAEAIYQVIVSSKPPLRTMLGRRENALKIARRFLPGAWFEKLLHRYFPKLSD